MARKVPDPSVAVRLREAIQDSGLSLNQLGQRAGIDHSRLSRFVRGERDLTLDSVDKLCRVLGLQLANATAEAMGEAGAVARTDVVSSPSAEDMPPAQQKPRGRKARRPRGG
jgi:transcriptional regulator with XRE-family HTH domain